MSELVDQVFIGDNQISQKELRMIDNVGVIELNVDFFEANALCNTELEIRPDYNDTLIRITDRKLLAADSYGYKYNQTRGAITVQNANATSNKYSKVFL